MPLKCGFSTFSAFVFFTHACTRSIAGIVKVNRLACYLQLTRKDGATPLHEAAAAGHTEVVKVLMSVGATPDVTDAVSQYRP